MMGKKQIAGISLAVMGCGFVITLLLPYQGFAIMLLRGGFEAGLVGGLADWFAVTALFRHPLGIPIPHTSLLLRNRDKIVNSLISSFEQVLLNKESLKRELGRLQPLALAGKFMTKALKKKSNRDELLAFLQSLLMKLPLEQIAPQLQSALLAYMRRIDMRTIADKAAAIALQEKWDEKALDYVLSQGREWAYKPETRQMLGELAHNKISEYKAGGLMGFAVQAFAGFMTEDKLGVLIQQLLLSGIDDLSYPGHPKREQLLQDIRDQLYLLQNNTDMLDKLKEWAALKISAPETDKFILDKLYELRNHAWKTLEAERQKGGRTVFSVYRYIVRKAQEEKETVDRLEQRILSTLVKLVEDHHFRLGVLLKNNLDRLDDRSLVQMLEEKVGSDLQWIRVNGALCGFIVGLALTLIEWVRIA